jgi:hypothetical protein
MFVQAMNDEVAAGPLHTARADKCIFTASNHRLIFGLHMCRLGFVILAGSTAGRQFADPL